MDTPDLEQVVTIRLYGSVRGKTIASIAHAFALAEFKLSLNPAATNAPWRLGTAAQDYFVWRKSVVEEKRALEATLRDLLGGQIIDPGVPTWPVVRGVQQYEPAVASDVAKAYARGIVKACGLGQ